MKILHIIPTYLPALRYGGTTCAVHGLAAHFAKLKHEVHVYTTDVDGPFDLSVPLEVPVSRNGIQVHYFKTKWSRRLYVSPSMERMLYRSIRYFDLLHLHSIFLWPTAMAARLAAQSGIPYMISPHGMLNRGMIRRKSRWIKSAWIQLVERNNLKRAAGIHMTSNYEVAEAERFGFRLPEIFVVPNGLDFEKTDDNASEVSPAVQSLLGRKNMILFIGRISWEKGLERLINALAAVPDAYLVIAGNADEKYSRVLQKIILTNGLKNRIHFPGPVYGADKEALLKSATIFIMPSLSENFGIAVLEAMAAGCPVIVTPEVGLSDAVKKFGAGVVSSGALERLAESIRGLLSNPVLRRKMGECGRQAAKDHFNWNDIAKQMEDVYLKIIQRSRHAD